MVKMPQDWRGSESAGLRGRVKLGELLRGGIEPTPQLVEGLIYEGRIHSIASSTGTGKTLIAQLLALTAMREKGLPVLYLDAENGPKIMAERLQEMGAELDMLDELFHYYPADLTLEDGSVAALQATVDELQPALVVFDSLADFLGAAGMDENSNSDCTCWFTEIAQPLKDAGVAVLVLDHIPKSGKGPRGASSKVAKMDVQWELEVKQRFDRGRTGEIELVHTKDRECWLPKIVRFSIGGGVFARSAGTIEEADPHTRMTDNAGKVYDAIKKAGDEGARWSDLEREMGGSKGAVTRGLNELKKHDLVAKRGQRYHIKDGPPGPGRGGSNDIEKQYQNGDSDDGTGGTSPGEAVGEGPILTVVPENPIDTPYSGSTKKYQNSTTVDSGTGDTGVVPPVPPPFRGGTGGTTDAQTESRGHSEGGTEEADRTEHQPSIGSGEAGKNVRLTAEEVQKVQRLISEGMEATAARAEVLADREEEA